MRQRTLRCVRITEEDSYGPGGSVSRAIACLGLLLAQSNTLAHESANENRRKRFGGKYGLSREPPAQRALIGFRPPSALRNPPHKPRFPRAFRIYDSRSCHLFGGRYRARTYDPQLVELRAKIIFLLFARTARQTPKTPLKTAVAGRKENARFRKSYQRNGLNNAMLF